MAGNKNLRLLLGGYPTALPPTLHSGWMAMAETPRQCTEATEPVNYMLSLGHGDKIRNLRISVNGDYVRPSVLRVTRSMGVKMDFGQKLRVLRKRAGFTSMESFAEAIELRGASSVQRYETGSFPNGLPLNFVQKILPVLTERGIHETEVLALAGEAGSLIRGDAEPEQITKDLEQIPITRARMFLIALAEHQRDRTEILSPNLQGDIFAAACRWYEEEVAAGRESADVSLADAKRFISLSHRLKTL